ncbi:MAG: hypothetical protein E7389_01780 [Ruminococcaceae bacterium]|nr:hypothetical protein [Oscillospiraceae bacterium]
MSWSRVKTVLIVFFLFVDAFLIYNTFVRNRPGTDISAQTVSNTVKVLANAGITVNPDIIKQKTPTLKKPEISNSVDGRQKLAENLMGNDIKKTENGFESDKGRIVFNAVAFSYENFDSDVSLKGIEEKNAIDVAASYLSKHGFDVKSSAVRDFNAGDNGYYIKFGKEIDGYPLYESYLDIYIEKSGRLTRIEGYWPEIYEQSVNSGKVSCIDRTKVLINLLSVPELNLDEKNEVADIQTGYTLGGLPDSDSPILLTLLPAYRVILKNGENYIFDATNGEFLYKS